MSNGTHNSDKTIDELEQNITKAIAPVTYSAARSGNSGGELKTSAILEVCKRAAEHVQNLYRMHQAEGETMAMHLEQIGETFMQFCKEAADKVRAMRVIPQEMAEQISDELLHIGDLEAKRHATVTHGLMTARDALLAIERREEESEKEKGVPNG